MAINFTAGLSNLRSRRLGFDRDPSLILDRQDVTESYEKRSDQAAIKYTLGAMAEVDPKYTEISIEQCVRIANQLVKGLDENQHAAEYRLQGSVPLNTHIRGVSDVDFLAIMTKSLQYHRGGARANSYWPYNGPGLVVELLGFRDACEQILSSKFPAAKVDTSGKKSIKVSGGSLRREVDVVPSFWYDSIEYQSSKSENDRGICIVDRSVPMEILNYPFLHISKIHSKDLYSTGGHKMAIRLAKNLKNDSDRNIKLSSYEIAGLFWHCDSNLIMNIRGYELSVLAGASTFLNRLAEDYSYTAQLKAPDGTRKLIDKNEKFGHLVELAQEMSNLAEEVYRELPNQVRQRALTGLTSKEKILKEHNIPIFG